MEEKYRYPVKHVLLILVLLWVLLVLLLSIRKQDRENVSQHIAERYLKGTTQVSVFLEEQEQVSEWDIRELLSYIYEQIQREEADLKEKKHTLPYCYSSQVETAAKRKNKSISVSLYGVCGDFFAFHPFPLRCGGYLEEMEAGCEVPTGKAVVTTQTAFALCGSTDVAGLTLLLNGKPFLIQGVIEVADAKAESRMSEEERAGLWQIYISGADFKQLFSEGEEFSVTALEVLLPNPVKNYGSSLLGQCVQQKLASVERMEIVENSGRFSFPCLIQRVKEWKKYIVRQDAITYPFWENAARVQEIHSGLKLITALLLLISTILQTASYHKRKRIELSYGK